MTGNDIEIVLQKRWFVISTEATLCVAKWRNLFKNRFLDSAAPRSE
jgi:hypothetical protein